jgi:hypothetical protein
MAELFGFQITRVKQTPDPKQSFTQPKADDGTQTVAAGGYFGQYLDMEGTAKTEQDLIRRYREISIHPECDMAVEDIVNEAIVANEIEKDPVRVDLKDTDFSDNIKRKVEDEFKEVLRLLNFSTKGHDIFRRWYVDGRIYYHKIIDRESPIKGITELRYIDPRKIKKIREIKKGRPVPLANIQVIHDYNEYFLYNEKGVAGPGMASGGLKIAPDAVTFTPSGLVDLNKNMVMSYMHKAIKPVNQLRMIEDAVVIYRIARAPERRIFKIDVGNLPKVKAEQYLRDVMARYRNKLVYDASTGEIRDDRNYMSMLEDFWLPSREGGRGTDITTLPGGQNLGEVADIEYFQRKLYRSLNVPISRLEASQGFNLGRSTEITRDELKFTKFVQRLRKKFTELFNDLLRTQLVLKAIINEDDWVNVKEKIKYDFLADGHFSELKNAELLRERIGLANDVRDYVGKYFSVKYVRQNILKQSEREMHDIDKQIKKEINDGIIAAPNVAVAGDEPDII